MDNLNKKSHINQIVLRAKIGGKNEYEELRVLYSFLLDQIFYAFCEIYPFLKTRKIDFYHDYYFTFWDAINTYNFTNDLSFSSHLKDNLIDGAKVSLSNQYGFEKADIVSKDEIKGLFNKKPSSKNRKKVERLIKSLTIKQKHILCIHCYFGLTQEKCRKLMGVPRINVEKVLGFAYSRIRNKTKKVKKGVTHVKYKERVHKIYQQKMENLK